MVKKDSETQTTGQGPMVYLSKEQCLEKDSTRVYDALINLQSEMGCKLRKMKENDPEFDKFVGHTYIKAMTHKNDGRTVMILGKDHHGVAARGYFDIDPDPYVNKSGRGFGDLVRWAHLGNSIEKGVLLVDFETDASSVSGVARTPQEVQQLLGWLTEYNFDPKKQVYLTESRRICEPDYGKGIRSAGISTLGDWIGHEFPKVDIPTRKTIEDTVSTPTVEEETTRVPMRRFSGGGGSLRTSNLW